MEHIEQIRREIDEYYENWFRINRAYDRWAQRHGTSDNTLFALYTISACGDRGCTQRHICNEILLPKQTVSFILSKLEKQGLLRRREDPAGPVVVRAGGCGNTCIPAYERCAAQGAYGRVCRAGRRHRTKLWHERMTHIQKSPSAPGGGAFCWFPDARDLEKSNCIIPLLAQVLRITFKKIYDHMRHDHVDVLHLFVA